jgi:hypothetical protein
MRAYYSICGGLHATFVTFAPIFIVATWCFAGVHWATGGHFIHQR